MLDLVQSVLPVIRQLGAAWLITVRTTQYLMEY